MNTMRCRLEWPVYAARSTLVAELWLAQEDDGGANVSPCLALRSATAGAGMRGPGHNDHCTTQVARSRVYALELHLQRVL